MCIICDNDKIGDDYLIAYARAIDNLKQMEKALLLLSNIKNITYNPSIEKAKNYNKAHKELVRIRKSINKVELLRSGNVT